MKTRIYAAPAVKGLSDFLINRIQREYQLIRQKSQQTPIK